MAHYAFQRDNEYSGRCVECGPQYSMPIHNTCKKNHTFCDFCYENVYRLTGCEICSNESTSDRNFYVDRLNMDPTVCRHKSRGCKYVSTDPVVLEKHNQGCKSRMFNCEVHMFGLERCYWVGGIFQIPEHFEEHHPEYYNKLINDTVVIAKFNLQKEQRSLHLVKVGEEIFYYKHKLDLTEGKFYVNVQLVGLEETANKYFYQFDVKAGNRAMNLLEMCHSDGLEDSHIFRAEKCAVIPVKTLKSYVVDDQLRFEFKISKVVT